MMMEFNFGKTHDGKGNEALMACDGIARHQRVEELTQEIMSIYDKEVELMDKIHDLQNRNPKMFSPRIKLLNKRIENYEDSLCLLDYLLYVGDNAHISDLLYLLEFRDGLLESRLDLHYLEAQTSLLDNMDKQMYQSAKDIYLQKKRMGFSDDNTPVSSYQDKWVHTYQELSVYQERLITLLSKDHSSERNQLLEEAYRQSILNCNQKLSVLGVMIRFGCNSIMRTMVGNYTTIQTHLDRKIVLLADKEVNFNAVCEIDQMVNYLHECIQEIESRIGLCRESSD